MVLTERKVAPGEGSALLADVEGERSVTASIETESVGSRLEGEDVPKAQRVTAMGGSLFDYKGRTGPISYQGSLSRCSPSNDVVEGENFTCAFAIVASSIWVQNSWAQRTPLFQCLSVIEGIRVNYSENGFGQDTEANKRVRTAISTRKSDILLIDIKVVLR